MHIVNLNVGEGRSRPCAGSPERETEARRGAGCGPAPTRQCGTEPQLDGPPVAVPTAPAALCVRAVGRGRGGVVFLRGCACADPGWGGSAATRGRGSPPEHSPKRLPWQRSPRRLRETPDPASPVRVSECPPRLTWSPKTAECSRLSSPKSPMEPRPPRTSLRPALSCSGRGEARPRLPAPARSDYGEGSHRGAGRGLLREAADERVCGTSQERGEGVSWD